MKKLEKLVLMFTLALLLAVTSANHAEASSVKLNHTSVTLLKNHTVTLKVKGTKKKASWSTSDDSVATVSSKGKVTAKDSGTATISAEVNGQTLECQIKVESPSLGRRYLIMDQGSTYQLELKDASGKVTWKVKNTKIAKIDKNGLVTSSGSKTGKTYITAKYKGKTYRCDLKVTNYAKNYDIVKKEIEASPRKDEDGNKCLVLSIESSDPIYAAVTSSTISYLQDEDMLKFTSTISSDVFSEEYVEELGSQKSEVTAVMYVNMMKDNNVECKVEYYLDDAYLGGTGTFEGSALDDVDLLDFDVTYNQKMIDELTEDVVGDVSEEEIEADCDRVCGNCLSLSMSMWTLGLLNDTNLYLTDLGVMSTIDSVIWNY